MEFISTRRGNSVFDELKERVYQVKMLEERKLAGEKQNGELEEALDTLESEFVLNLFKIDDVAELSSMGEDLQRKFLEQKMYVEKMDISERAKLQSILTTASILSRVNTRTQDLKDTELYLLSGAMVQVPIEDYSMYGDVLSQPVLLQSVLTKTENTKEQLDMCSKILDYCGTFYHENGSELDYQRVLKDTLNIVGEYKVLKKGKEK